MVLLADFDYIHPGRPLNTVGPVHPVGTHRIPVFSAASAAGAASVARAASATSGGNLPAAIPAVSGPRVVTAAVAVQTAITSAEAAEAVRTKRVSPRLPPQAAKIGVLAANTAAAVATATAGAAAASVSTATNGTAATNFTMVTVLSWN